jgi:hypothetical protein
MHKLRTVVKRHTNFSTYKINHGMALLEPPEVIIKKKGFGGGT